MTRQALTHLRLTPRQLWLTTGCNKPAIRHMIDDEA
jgi:hypothetical protein